MRSHASVILVVIPCILAINYAVESVKSADDLQTSVSKEQRSLIAHHLLQLGPQLLAPLQLQREREPGCPPHEEYRQGHQCEETCHGCGKYQGDTYDEEDEYKRGRILKHKKLTLGYEQGYAPLFGHQNAYPKERCFCRDGFVRIYGTCRRRSHCKKTCKNPHEEYRLGNECDDTCKNHLKCDASFKRDCHCKKGYRRVQRECVENQWCNCPGNTTYHDCGPVTEYNCFGDQIRYSSNKGRCQRGCYCDPRYVIYKELCALPIDICPNYSTTTSSTTPSTTTPSTTTPSTTTQSSTGDGADDDGDGDDEDEDEEEEEEEDEDVTTPSSTDETTT